MTCWIETMIQCWEQEVEKQTLVKGHLCYTTRDNAEVTLRHAVVVVTVSTQTHQPCIHKYFDFHSWWTAVAVFDGSGELRPDIEESCDCGVVFYEDLYDC